MHIVAKVGRLYGAEGELSLNLTPAFPKDFNLNTPLFVRIDGLLVPLYCDAFSRRGVNGANVRFADIDTDRRASELIGSELFLLDIEESETPLDLDGLVGYKAIVDGIEGELTAFYPSEMNPLFEVTLGDGREILIPSVEQFIESLDVDNQTISFTPPEGLLDL